MALHWPLQEILTTTQALWPTNGRPEVVTEFRKVVDCRTLALGAEVYRSSGGDERIVPHTCKSRVCPSCGQR
ncbi:MAG TPA: transposase zinc-binding domain-containing protein, partial [Dehalococcoidia bacterium]|nr:transposase zinc-binding domain-containing protein [Dehalococcoidia bacterium]